MQGVSCRACIDRFEQGFAVLLLEGHAAPVLWPVDLLPEGSAEGSSLIVRLSRDFERESSGRASVESLIEKLERGD